MALISFSPPIIVEAVNGIDDNTVLMLHADNYVDSSQYNHSITTSVNVDNIDFYNGTGSFNFNASPFGIPSHSGFNFNTSDFTIDFWFKQPVTNNNEILCSGGIDDSWELGIYDTNNLTTLTDQLALLPDPSLVSNISIDDNEWHHVAIVRHSTSLMLFVDGQLDTSITVPLSYDLTSSDFNIGGKVIQSYTGWIDEFRVSNGIARWISNFVPRTTPYVAPGSGNDASNLLLLHFENSTSLNVETFDPANILLLTGDTLTDSSSANQTFTTTAVIDNIETMDGATLFFDNSSFILADQTLFHFGTDNFTIDCWTKQFDQTVRCLFGGTSSGEYTIGCLSPDILALFPSIPQGNVVINSDVWHHIALTRNADVLTLYVNGVPDISINIPLNYNWTADFTIGGTSTPLFVGWIENLRVTRGVVRWTSTFDPPITFNVLQLIDSSSHNYPSVHTVGTVLTGPSYAKYGDGVSFDNGNGYISTIANSDFNFGSLPWTIDFWVNFSSVNNIVNGLFSTGQQFKGVTLRYNGGTVTGKLELVLGDGTAWHTYELPFTPIISTWYHIAITRVSKTYKIFVNGALLGNMITTIKVIEGSYPLIIGRDHNNLQNFNMRGTMDEFRISRGVIRFNENFTPPVGPYS